VLVSVSVVQRHPLHAAAIVVVVVFVFVDGIDSGSSGGRDCEGLATTVAHLLDHR